MSTTTGNVKISQLSELGTIDNGTKLRIPVSKDKSATSTPNWESYSVSAAVLSKFMENSLGLNDVGSEKGLRSQVTDLKAKTAEYAKLEKNLGKYDLVNTINFTQAEINKVILTDGTKVSRRTGSYEYFISSKISLKQGNLYVWNVDVTTISNNYISFISKISTHEYKTEIETLYDTVYEPLPTHYHSNEYGAPSSPYLVFFATEDMDVVISGGAGCGTSLTEIKYGAFIQIADNLLSVNGELMKVIVEAIAKNKKDIDSLYEKTKSLGDIHVTSIDSDEFPSVQGEPMIVVVDRDPSPATTTRGADVPNRIGQIWVNTKDGVAYIATKLGFDGWKRFVS